MRYFVRSQCSIIDNNRECFIINIVYFKRYNNTSVFFKSYFKVKCEHAIFCNSLRDEFSYMIIFQRYSHVMHAPQVSVPVAYNFADRQWNIYSVINASAPFGTAYAET